MAYVTLSDYNGEIEMIFFPRVWESCRDRIKEDEVVIIRGKLEFQEKKDKYGFIADALIGGQEADTAIAEEDARRRKREKFRPTWEYMADLKSGGLAKAEKGSYTVMGILSSLRETKDRNGDDMAFGTLHDFEGDIDLVFFARVWKDCRDHVTLNEFAALKGNIDPENDRNPQKPGFKVSSVADLPALSRSAKKKAEAGEKPKVAPVVALVGAAAAEMAMAHTGTEPPSVAGENPPKAVYIRLDAGAADRDENLFPLRNYLGANHGPCPVFIHLSAGDGEKTICANAGINLDAEKETLGVLKGCTGVKEVWTE
jgi:DNA polymerase-3 subunit alpha